MKTSGALNAIRSLRWYTHLLLPQTRTKYRWALHNVCDDYFEGPIYFYLLFHDSFGLVDFFRYENNKSPYWDGHRTHPRKCTVSRWGRR